MGYPLNTVDVLTIANSYGIKVARTRYVDSAENAIVFANRRPIALCALRGDLADVDPDVVEAHLDDDDAIRHAYGRLAARGGPRVMAQAEVEPGSTFALHGERGPSGKVLRFVFGARDVVRVCPVSEDAAEEMLAEVRSHRGLGSSEKAVRTLAHLFVKASKMFEESGIEGFTLHVRVHDNGYRVTHGSMQSERAPQFRRRLARHAHDRKSYDYHPAGRQ